MTRAENSKSGLFLMELMLAILFFAISAAICLQMFAFASLTATRAENLSYATLAARSTAECYQATDGDLNQIAQLLGGTATADTLEIGYDTQWQSSQTEIQYQLTLISTENQGEITVTEIGADAPIYTLSVSSWGGGLS